VPASASAKRYAAAAFAVAAENDAFDAWLTTLTSLARILQMPSARVVFLSPAVPSEQKRAALDRLLPDAPPTVRNFLHILADRDRLDEVAGITDSLHDLINERRGIVTAEVTTAVPLDAEMERLVAERLATYLDRPPEKVVIRSRVDPTIIGGVIARIGDRLIDDSVRGRLDRLRQTLAGSTR
jgi:F-type H+-transporting ATPase subunit delta